MGFKYEISYEEFLESCSILGIDRPDLLDISIENMK